MIEKTMLLSLIMKLLGIIITIIITLIINDNMSYFYFILPNESKF